eukprot:gnl/MRDRNA2_/MRDRNA2_20033_c0_seq1.p1 gnl/MRDRNA2_/MRDRNA2_20033_c0~~gnl/MRDRNA2_/MRDRNA2_20033_c0_seq1.p1  ORF type:complete len:391 (+),score=31.88 gnl/MRDRNA2_/MRDRNA2_20033_c0_seq1:66-1238(+)
MGSSFSFVKSGSGMLAEYIGPMFYLVSPYSLALNATDEAPKFLLKSGIPMFFVFIGSEGSYMLWTQSGNKRFPKYHLSDLICSISSGVLLELTAVLMDAASVQWNTLLYTAVYNRFCLVKYDTRRYPMLTFFGLMLGVDLGYYMLHRVAHQYHTLWAAHRVHHSGEFYNFATALRQGVLQRFYSPFFYLPLALVFNPVAFVAHLQLNILYQFWVHTELVGWLGPLEYVFSTPSAHRMHHRPPGNCNYAGVFIIWDRIFGSYVCENDRGYKDWYGLARPTRTYDVLELNMEHFRNMKNIPGNLVHKLASRRDKTPWTFRPSALFQPLPQPSLADDGEVRSKYHGADISIRGKVLALSVGLMNLITFLNLLKRAKSLSASRTISGVCLCALV